jgi:hypothetical protein
MQSPEMPMRPLLLILGIIVAVAATGTSAHAQDYPWCGSYDTGDEARNCGFVSYEQCMTTVRGIGGFCMANNTYQAPLALHRRRSN